MANNTECIKYLKTLGHDEASAAAIVQAVQDGKDVAGISEDAIQELKDILEASVKVGARNNAEDTKRIREIRSHAKAIHGMTMEMEPTDGEDMEPTGPMEPAEPGKAITARPDVTEADKERAASEAENFADEKNKKYKLDTEEQIRAAWSYIGMPKNQAKYSEAEVAQIKKKIIAAWKDKINKEGPPSADGKSIDVDTVVSYGGEIKAMGETPDGLKVGGYLIRFSTDKTPDVTGDYFTKDTDFGEADKSDAYFHHGLDLKVGKRKLGKVDLKKDEFGVWAEGIIAQRDEYEKFIGEQVGAGKMGWSSGTAAHLVEREQVGSANWIKSWPLGLDASITHMPAEPRNTVVPLKSLIPAPQAASTASADQAKGEFTMDEETKKLIADTVAEAVKAAMPKPEPAGITTIIEKKQAPVTAKDVSDDSDGIKAFVHFCVTGDRSDDLNPARMREAYGLNPDGSYKTVQWYEGGTNDGYALVPPEFWKQIVLKRQEKSVIRQAGATVMPTSSNKVMVPVEDTREAAFVLTAEKSGTYDEGNTDPVSQKELDIFKYTRMLKISEELLRDSAYPVEGFLATRLAYAAALTENNLFAVGAGNGATGIEGVFVGGTAGKTFAGVATIAQTEPLDLYYALPAFYQDGASWLMRNATLGKIRALTGSWFSYQNTPAGETRGNVLGSTGENLNWKPVYVTDQCAAIGGGYKSVMVGNFEFYGIAENEGMVVQRNPWLYMANGLVAFFAHIRIGGGVLQAEAFQYGTHPTA